MIQIIEQTLSDGSIAYGVSINAGTPTAAEVDCSDYDAAHRLANTLEETIVGGQYDGWNPIHRAA